MQSSRRFGFWLGICGLLLAVLLPELVGATWHLLHGSGVAMSGWSIPVPSGWYAKSGSGEITISRMTYFPFIHPPPEIVFQRVDFAARFQFSTDLYSSVEQAVMAKRGYRFESRNTVPTNAGLADCSDFVMTANSNRRWIACVLPEPLLSADFSGVPADEPMVDSVLRGIKQLGKH